MFRHPKRYCSNKRCFPDLIYVGRVFLNRTASAWYFSVPPFAPTRLVCCCRRRPCYFSAVSYLSFLFKIWVELCRKQKIIIAPSGQRPVVPKNLQQLRVVPSIFIKVKNGSVMLEKMVPQPQSGYFILFTVCAVWSRERGGKLDVCMGYYCVSTGHFLR